MNLSPYSLLPLAAGLCSTVKGFNGHQPVSVRSQLANQQSRKINTPAFMRNAIHPNSALSMAFAQTDEIDLPEIDARLEKFTDQETGAMHYHIATGPEDKEKAFSIVFKTVPTDSTGVAHILEHTVLAGSEKYPVKDPFFSMMKRSLNTFLNAMTSSDWTQYPFSTNNQQDFFNLMSVYQDAVFFPLLNPDAFAQEGHRLEFSEPFNASSALKHSGVVYNEMKGMMSSISYDISQRMQSYLFPQTTYYHNSGGNPRQIPDLSYEQFVKFHQIHYHPNNAVFLTYGNIPASTIQQKIQDDVLSRFPKKSPKTLLRHEPKQLSPKQITEHYPFSSDNKDNNTYHLLGWVLNAKDQVEDRIEAQFLSKVLFGNSAAPLQKFLDLYPNGQAANSVNGLDDSAIQPRFTCAISASSPAHADDFETKLFSVLEDIAANGLPLNMLEAAHHQLSLSEREITGGRMPVSLAQLFKLLPSAVYDTDPRKLMASNHVLDKIGQRIKDPEYIKTLVRKSLLENNHRVRLTLIPSKKLKTDLDTDEASTLKSLEEQLTDDQKHQIIEKTRSMMARQEKIDDHNVLPILSLSDVLTNQTLPKPYLENTDHFVKLNDGKHSVSTPTANLYQAKTNGISYINTLIPMPQLSDQEQEIFPLFESILTKLGVNKEDYLSIQNKQSACSAGFNAFTNIVSHPKDRDQQVVLFGIASKSLNQNLEKTMKLLNETLESTRFDEIDRIKSLTRKLCTSAEQGISIQGRSYAILAASSHHSAVANYQNQVEGLPAIKHLKSIEASLQDHKKMCGMQLLFHSIFEKIKNSPRVSVAVSDHCDETVLELIKPTRNTTLTHDSLKHSYQPKASNQVWVTNTQVNHCAKSYTGVSEQHPDSAPLKVLSSMLSLEFLHQAIREKGAAYGGGAQYDHKNGVFNFYSYRDPRHLETIADFERSIDWIINTAISKEMLHQSQLYTISGLDRPGTPASEAFSDFNQKIQGRSDENHNSFKKQVLNVSPEDLKRVAHTYLKEQKGSTAIITNEKGFSEISLNSKDPYPRFDL